ncbi:MAG: prepilin-type N-terminal cleavage/methylation domain-containing protein [Phycisphaerae bacterium]|nr:prepilin-type N-terminal cleavage/methylation domain-containing protein [Phycisphaerae bacterium]
MSQHRNKGLTLIECSISISVASLLVLGVMAYNYHAAKHAREADRYATASRLGLALLENWRNSGTVAGYNPNGIYSPATVGSGYPVAVTANAAAGPALAGTGFTALAGSPFEATINNVTYRISLGYLNRATSVAGRPALTTLQAALLWAAPGETVAAQDAPRVVYTTYD